jgi:hypothetical protein
MTQVELGRVGSLRVEELAIDWALTLREDCQQTPLCPSAALIGLWPAVAIGRAPDSQMVQTPHHDWFPKVLLRHDIEVRSGALHIRREEPTRTRAVAAAKVESARRQLDQRARSTVAFDDSVAVISRKG